MKYDPIRGCSHLSIFCFHFHSQMKFAFMLHLPPCQQARLARERIDFYTCVHCSIGIFVLLCTLQVGVLLAACDSKNLFLSLPVSVHHFQKSLIWLYSIAESRVRKPQWHCFIHTAEYAQWQTHERQWPLPWQPQSCPADPL